MDICITNASIINKQVINTKKIMCIIKNLKQPRNLKDRILPLLIGNFLIFTFLGCERVQHGEDGSYIWAYGGWDGGYDNQNVADKTTSERYRTLLANFVKYL